MALVNLTKAAEMAGISRAHLYKHYINNGKISVTVSHVGKRLIDTSEILRVFGTLHGVDNSAEQLLTNATSNEHTKDTSETLLELRLLRELVKSKDEALEAKERHINDLREALRLIEHTSKKPWYKFW